MRRETEEGFEQHFGIDHLGQFLLTNLLRPPVRAAVGARVVCLSSSAMLFASPTRDLADVNWEERPYDGWRACGASNPMNAMFAIELHERWSGDAISATAVHPGIIPTELGGSSPGT